MGSVELARLVDVAAQRLNVNVEYDAAALKGTVTLRLGSAISDEELWVLMNRTLAARGLTTVRGAGASSYSVVKIGEAGALAPVVVPGAVDADLPAGYRTAIVRVVHRPAKDVADALSRVLSKTGGAVAPIGDGGLVMISDLAPRVDQALELIKLVDVPAVRIAVEEIEARNLGPAQLAAAAVLVASKRDAVRGDKAAGDVLVSPNGNAVIVVAPEPALPEWRALISSLDRREPVVTATYSSRYFPAPDVARLAEDTIRVPSDDRWKLVVDELTGSLVVTATPTQHEAVAALLERLAATPTEARRPVRTFVIRNRPVREVQGVLERLLQAGVIEASSIDPFGADPALASPAGYAPATGGDTPAVISLPPAPTASGTPPMPPVAGSAPAVGRDGAFVRSGGSRSADSARRGFGSGDRAPADRPLTLTVDEGTNTLIAVGEPRLLAQVEALLKALDVRQAQVMLEVLMVTLSESQTLDLGVELEDIEMSGSVRIRLSSLFGLGVREGEGAGAGFTGVVLSPGDFSIVVRALETLASGRSLSMPKLLVGNNQVASLDSVVQQPFASVNASNTVSTTSFGGTQDAGTVVTIKPQIAEGDHLVLDYSVSLSAFLGNPSAPTLPPPRQQNRVQSAATIPDGYTIVVGGIDIESESKSVSQVPLLGRIPVLGELFKTRSKSGSRSRFYVFIRANILRGRGFEDLKYLSDRDVAVAGVEDGWPTVEPRIIR